MQTQASIEESLRSGDRPLHLEEIRAARDLHAWIHPIHLFADIETEDPILRSLTASLLDSFSRQGHHVQDDPDAKTELMLTTAEFYVPLDWRKALLFNQRRRFKIEHKPPILCLMHATPGELETLLRRLQAALDKQPPDPADFQFPGMASSAYKVLIEQGQRGGPILALERVLQSQAKCIRILLVVGQDKPEYAYLFNLVGAHPHIPFDSPDSFCDDVVKRLVAEACSHEVTNHQVVGDVIHSKQFNASKVPAAMRRASLELGKRNFFTAMVCIDDLVHVPALDRAIADQYSEGCFATWDPQLRALIATVTGSARPVDKGDLTDDDLSVIVGVQPDGSGALVRHVAGKRNDSPSSESVEMMGMDRFLPRIELDSSWPLQADVPVVRSKLHGHRGIASYDPSLVEYIQLDPPYYHYPVSCSTDSQARAITSGFARSEALQKPDDPRLAAFAVLPGHGIVIAEKWISGTAPFQILWEYFDSGVIEVVKEIPQGPLAYAPNADGQMILHTS